MAALTVRQQLAQQLAAFIWRRGGSVTNQFPLKESEHIRFEARLSDESLVGDLKRFGFNLRLLALSTRVDPWAVTEILPVDNTQQLRRRPGVVNICVYEVELPGNREREQQRRVRPTVLPLQHRRFRYATRCDVGPPSEDSPQSPVENL